MDQTHLQRTDTYVVRGSELIKTLLPKETDTKVSVVISEQGCPSEVVVVHNSDYLLEFRYHRKA